MAAVWSTSEDFSHGWLIAPISMWLVWRNRQTWLHQPWTPSAYAILLVLLFSAIWVLGILVGANVLRSLAVVGFLLASVLLVCGRKIFVANLFPMLFLFAMVPAGHALVPFLMEYTADATVFALRATGLAVYRENLHFVLPTGRWSVVEACSGLRYVIASVVLGLLFAYLNYESWVKRAVLCVSCLVIAIVANWARAYTVVLVGHFSQMRYGTGDDHVWYGWVFFGVVMSLVFWIGMKFGDKPVPYRAQVTPVPILVNPPSGFRTYGVVLAGLLLMVGARFLPVQLQEKNEVRFTSSDLTSKLKIRDFAPVQENSAIPLTFSDSRAQVVLSSPDGTTLWAAYYARQQEGAEMLSHTNLSLADKLPSASLLQQSTLNVSNEGDLIETRMMLGNQEFVFWRWFFVDKHQTSSPYMAKLWRLLSQLVARGDHSFVLVLARPVNGNIEEQRKILRAAKTDLTRELIRLSDGDQSIR